MLWAKFIKNHTTQMLIHCPLFLGISAVLFETRIGCLKTDVPKETEDFIQSINTMFQMTLLTMAMPKFLHKIYPGPWQRFVACWDYMFAFGEEFVLSIC